MYAFTDLSWLPILVATIAYFALGAIWYSFLFQKQWIRYQKINTSDPGSRKGAGVIMLVGFVWTFIMVTGIAVLASRISLYGGALSGMKLGLTTGILSALAISMTYLYLKRPAGLHLIDGLYHVLGQIIAAIILIVWK